MWINKRKKLIITIGNIYLDRNVLGIDWGGSEVLKPGKAYFAQQCETAVGGSAVNFALQVRKLNTPVAFLGKVGKDEEGKNVKNLLRKQGIIDNLVQIEKGHITSCSFNIVLPHNGEFVGIDWGNASKKLSIKDINLNHPLFQKANVVYFGGTAKQDEILNNFPMIAQGLHKLGIKVILDLNRFSVGTKNTRKEILDSLKYVDCYMPNEDEIKELTVKSDLDQALGFVIEKGAKLVVVKRGDKGCRIKTSEVDINIPAFKVRPITSVGAGDIFNGAFIVKYFGGHSLEESALFANGAGAIKVEQNKIPNFSEIESFIKTH